MREADIISDLTKKDFEYEEFRALTKHHKAKSKKKADPTKEQMMQRAEQLKKNAVETEKIQLLMRSYGITQRDVAYIMGINEGTLVKLLKNPSQYEEKKHLIKQAIDILLGGIEG